MRTTHSNEKGRGAGTHTTRTTRSDHTALSPIESRGDHKEASLQAKDVALAFVATSGRLLGGV